MDVLVGGRVNTIAKAPFATGGEAALHDMQWAGSSLAVKLYRVDSRRGDAEHRRAHADWLVAHPPPQLRDVREGWEVAWPTDVVTTLDGRFLGVAVPRVRGAVRLSELTAHAWTVSRRMGARWTAYELPSRLALGLRLQLAERVARAVAAVHASGCHVLADLKPDNILVHADGRVTLVDCDSIQVVEQGVLRHAAPVRTDEYTPREGIVQDQVAERCEGLPLAPSWDAFSLAVISYQLLLGVHPFAVQGVDPVSGAPIQTVRDAIHAGMYAHHTQHANSGRMHSAAPHSRLLTLPPALRVAFAQTFVGGHDDPTQRLTPSSWATLLCRSGSRWPQLLRLRRLFAMRRAVVGAQGRLAWASVLRTATGAFNCIQERRVANRYALRDAWRANGIHLRDLVFLQSGAMAMFFWLYAELGDRIVPSLDVVRVHDGGYDVTATPAWMQQLMEAPPGLATEAATGAPLLKPVGDVLGLSGNSNMESASALTAGTVLTYARAGRVAWRDSVADASDSRVVLLRRAVVNGAMRETTDTVRYERTEVGLRLRDARAGILLLPNGARVGDTWRSDEVPASTVQATAIRHVQTLAGPFAIVELVVDELRDGRMRRRQLSLNAQYGVVRVEEDAPESVAAELVAVTPPDGHQATRMGPRR